LHELELFKYEDIDKLLLRELAWNCNAWGDISARHSGELASSLILIKVPLWNIIILIKLGGDYSRERYYFSFLGTLKLQ
jgi:hypothetical protein